MALDRATEQSIALLLDAFDAKVRVDRRRAVWRELFDQTVDEHFAAEAGAALHDRARKIDRNLQLALSHRPEGRP